VGIGERVNLGHSGHGQIVSIATDLRNISVDEVPSCSYLWLGRYIEKSAALSAQDVSLGVVGVLAVNVFRANIAPKVQQLVLYAFPATTAGLRGCSGAVLKLREAQTAYRAPRSLHRV